MIVGAQKAGTTSLKNYLGEHPEILSHPQTEFAYFSDDESHVNDYSKAYSRHFTKGKPDAKLVVAKSASMYTSPMALQRLMEHNSNCKIVFILRDPVKRAISSFNMETSNAATNETVESLIEAIKDPITNKKSNFNYIERGLYAKQYESLISFFPEGNIKTLLFEDLQKSSLEMIQELYQWLEIDHNYLPNLDIKHNTTRQSKSKIMAKVLNKLRQNNNPVKRFAKTVLPYSIFSKIGQLLMDSNKSKKSPQKTPEEVTHFLYDYFSEPNMELQRISGIDVSIWKK